MSQAIADAVHQLERHRGIVRVGAPVAKGSSTWIEIDVEVALPSRSRSSGVSTTGVRAIETCTLVFGPRWPLTAPQLFLRADFPLDLPHINPHTPGHLVSPCLFEGFIDELLHRFGLDAIIDQLIIWLDSAAANMLIDLNQGWEPTRRDSCPSTVVFSAEKAVAAARHDGSILTVGVRYIAIGEHLHGIVDEQFTAVDEAVFSQTPQNDHHGKWAMGKAAAFIVGAPHVNAQPHVVCQYQPETVIDLESLLIRAGELGIDQGELGRALHRYYARSIVDPAEDSKGWELGLFAIVILVVERPAPLIGSPGRRTEVLPYVVHYNCSEGLGAENNTSAYPALHAHALSPQLLQLASGMASADTTQPWVMIGCGSLGSKIALHLGKAGFGSATFVDNEPMSPHNVARHGLIEPICVGSPPRKATMMQSAFQAISHTGSRAFDMDAVALLTEVDKFEEVVSKEAALIVDTTASLKLLTAQMQSPALDVCGARLARVVMYGQGRCAVIALEGKARTSRVDDLTALLFEFCRHHPSLRASIAGDSAEPTRIFVGDNCRSLTAPMTDATVSRSAALASMQLEQWLKRGLPSDGTLCVGVLDQSGIGMNWSAIDIGETVVLEAKGAGGWRVRVLEPLAHMLNLQALDWGSSETGGALVGRITNETRTITIAGLVVAPPDSIREPARFILGKEGLVASLRQAHADSLGYLTFLGTWHTHPLGGPHSGIDRETLKGIATDAAGIPAVSLVWTPQGLTCEVDRW